MTGSSTLSSHDQIVSGPMVTFPLCNIWTRKLSIRVKSGIRMEEVWLSVYFVAIFFATLRVLFLQTMAELKTKQNDASITDFIASVDDEQKRADALALLDIFAEATGLPAKMWGTSIIGYGSYHYKYKSGQEGDWMLTAFSPRKQQLSIYIMPGTSKYPDLLAKLGKHKTSGGCSGSCLYIKRLSDVDTTVLKKLIKQSVADMQKMYPA